uniref:Uncharacterized protein n=1 Tax=Romanomermis culicivorax TaxID=13658 RepID=A0A915K0N4_ROMCU
MSRVTMTSHDHSLVDGTSKHTLNGTNQSPDILVGIYFGKRVIAKKYNKLGGISFHKKDLLFIKAMKDAKHDNINNFVGFVANGVSFFYSFWSACSRGSLEDVLFNDMIKIDETFQVSLLRDVVSVEE